MIASRLRSAYGSGALGAVALAVANALLGYGTTATLTWHLAPEALGDFTFALSVVTLATLPATAGLPNVVVREVAAASATGDWGPVKGLLIRGHQWSLGAACGVGAVALAAGSRGPLSPELLLPTLVALPVVGISGLRAAVVRGLRRVALAQAPELLLRPIGLLALVLAADLRRPGEVMWAHVAATTASAVVGMAAAWGIRPFAWGLVAARYDEAGWVRAVLALALGQSMALVSGAVGALVLGGFGASEEVATWRVASQIAVLAGFGYTALNQLALPTFTRALAAGDQPGLARAATRGARAATAIALGVLGVLVVAGPDLFDTLFGPPYRSAAAPATVLAVGQVVNAGSGFAAAALTAGRHEGVASRVLLASGAFGVALTAALGPVGPTGVAFAVLSQSILQNTWLWWEARRRLSLDTSVLGLPVRAPRAPG